MMRKVLIFLICLLLSSAALAITTEHWYVDPDAGGGGTGVDWTNAYTTLSAWEAAKNADITAGGSDKIMIVHCRSSSGGNDQAQCIISGWTTDSTHYIQIKGYDFPSDGIWDDTKYILENNDDSADALRIEADYVRLINLQILLTTTSGTMNGLLVSGVNASNAITIDSCIVKGVCSGTGDAYAIYSSDADGIITVYNTIVYGFVSGVDSGFGSVRIVDGAITFYNCTIWDGYFGLRQTGGTCTIKNSCVGNTTDDFSGTFTMDYIVSDDDHSGDCSNYWSAPTNGTGDWSLDYTTPGSDFTLLVTATDLIDDGLADVFAEDDDIIGTVRPQGGGWDIGAYEYTSSSVVPIIVNIQNQ